MRARVVSVLAALLVVGIGGASHPVAAAPLEPEDCGSLADEHKQMVGTGIEAELAKGPDWAKANLDADGLDRIKHFLAIEEQLRFRCPLVRHVKTEGAAAPGKAGTGIPLPMRNPERLAKAGPSASAEPALVKQN